MYVHTQIHTWWLSASVRACGEYVHLLRCEICAWQNHNKKTECCALCAPTPHYIQVHARACMQAGRCLPGASRSLHHILHVSAYVCLLGALQELLAADNASVVDENIHLPHLHGTCILLRTYVHIFCAFQPTYIRAYVPYTCTYTHTYIYPHTHTHTPLSTDRYWASFLPATGSPLPISGPLRTATPPQGARAAGAPRGVLWCVVWTYSAYILVCTPWLWHPFTVN